MQFVMIAGIELDLKKAWTHRRHHVLLVIMAVFFLSTGLRTNWAIGGEASIIGWLLQTKALIMIIFANILLDKQIITSETFTALLLMAVASTMLTVPMVAPKLARLKALILRTA